MSSNDPIQGGSDEGLTRQDPTAARLETFSDGVIAIAITLLVLDLRIPPGEGSDASRLLDAILRL